VSKLWLIAPGGIERGTHSTKKLLFTIGKILLPKTLQHHLKKRIGSVDYQKAGKLQSIFKKVVNEDLREFSVQVFQPLSLYW
jgi:hypothetical protein